MSLGPIVRLIRHRATLRRVRREASRAELVKALKSVAEAERWIPGMQASARALYEEAVALCRELDDPLLLAHTVRHLGDVHHDRERAALAQQCYDEALAIYEQHGHGHPLDFANAVRRVAVLKEEAGDHAQAERRWQEAHDLYVRANEPMGIAESAAWLALLARRRGDATRSREWLTRASAAADASRHKPSLVWVSKVRAEVEGAAPR